MSGQIVYGDGRGWCRCPCGCTEESGPQIYCAACRVGVHREKDIRFANGSSMRVGPKPKSARGWPKWPK